MRIITNADDFGRDEDTVAATIECFRSGALTSATIMPTMPATGRAIEFAKANPQFSFGVHLTYVREDDTTSEHPFCPPRMLSDLVDTDGRFLNSNVVRRKALLNRIPINQIEAETIAQLGVFQAHGIPVSHVDSHGHLHKFKPFREVLARVLPRFGIERVRSAQDLYLHKPLRSPTFWFGGGWRRKLRGMFRTTDHFFMPSARDTDWPGRILGHPAIKGAGQETPIEIGVHPGRAEAWRDAERCAIEKFAGDLDRGSHRLIGWREL